MTTEYSQETARLAAKYDFIVYPLDYSILKRTLTSYEYKIPQAPQSAQALPEGVLTVEGQIGKKDDFVIDVSTERQIFGLSSASSLNLESEFNKLEDSLSEQIGSPLSSKARFYEFIYNAIVRTGNNPLECLARVGKNHPLFEKSSKILGTKVSPFNFRVSPTGIPVESENWFDFTIEPVMNKATVAYHIGLVYRDKQKPKVLAKISNLKTIVEDSLSLLEDQ